LGWTFSMSAGLHRFGNLLAADDAAARERDVAENIRVHRHLVNRDRPDAARADDQNLAQFHCSISRPRRTRESAHIGSWRYSAKSD
jgi:hypothetical protein